MNRHFQNAYRYGCASVLMHRNILNAVPLSSAGTCARERPYGCWTRSRPPCRFLATYRRPQVYSGENMDGALHDPGTQ